MLAIVKKSDLQGEVTIPGSKSHMIRALYFGTLAEGVSTILNPVQSRDALSCLDVCRKMGAELDMSSDHSWTIKGVGQKNIEAGRHIYDVGNSGTSLYLGVGFGSSFENYSIFTGDEQITKRPIQPALDSLKRLGVFAESTRNNGSAPVIIKGPNRGGRTVINGLVSAYVSSIILSCTLALADCEIEVEEVNEIPYINITLDWAERIGLSIQAAGDRSHFYVRGNQEYTPYTAAIPGDFSSAAFLAIGAAITDSDITLHGLDMDDVQGDKLIIDLLKDMGADIDIKEKGRGGIRIKGSSRLKGRSIDLSVIPDSVPILAVLGCSAEGETRLFNIKSSRVKETDRPLLITRELRKMGAEIELKEDELVIKKSDLSGAYLESYGDHRMAMAGCIAGLIADGVTIVNNVECSEVSFPGFDRSLEKLQADVFFCEQIRN